MDASERGRLINKLADAMERDINHLAVCNSNKTYFVQRLRVNFDEKLKIPTGVKSKLKSPVNQVMITVLLLAIIAKYIFTINE